jgi:hypothetical protein
MIVEWFHANFGVYPTGRVKIYPWKQVNESILEVSGIILYLDDTTEFNTLFRLVKSW